MVDLSALTDILPGMRVSRRSMMVNPHTKQFEHYTGFVMFIGMPKSDLKTPYEIDTGVSLYIQFDNWMEMGRPDGEGGRITHDQWYEYRFLFNDVWISHDDLILQLTMIKEDI